MMFKTSIRLALVLYAAVVGIVGQFAALDSADLGYPVAVVMASSLSYLSLAAAVLIVALGWRPPVIRYWKPVFWLNCADLTLGLWMDATLPQDVNMANSPTFLFTVMTVLAFLLPAYFFSYVVAYRRRSDPTQSD